MAVRTGDQERAASCVHGSPAAVTCVSGGNGPSGLCDQVTPGLPSAPSFPAPCVPGKEVPRGTGDSKALGKTPQALGGAGSPEVSDGREKGRGSRTLCPSSRVAGAPGPSPALGLNRACGGPPLTPHGPTRVLPPHTKPSNLLIYSVGAKKKSECFPSLLLSSSGWANDQINRD